MCLMVLPQGTVVARSAVQQTADEVLDFFQIGDVKICGSADNEEVTSSVGKETSDGQDASWPVGASHKYDYESETREISQR